MRENGTDRDIALQMVSLLNDINTALVNINDHKFVPHIITQPTDQEVAVGGTVTLAVVANNVKSYQWQYLPAGTTQSWTNSSMSGSTTATMTFTAASNRYLTYRCKITGLNNAVIYTNPVTVTQPES